jgi:hypothetical protein
VEAVEVVEAVEAVEVEVVAEEYHHQDHPKPPDRMSQHHKEKSKLWDNSHMSSQETEAKPTTSSMSFVAIFN